MNGVHLEVDEALSMERDTEQETETTKLICTANHGFAPYAQEELRRLFGSVKTSMLVPGEVFAVTLQHRTEDILTAIGTKEPIFLRHIFPVQWESAPGGAGEMAWLHELVEFISSDHKLNGSKIAIQPRKSEQSCWGDSAADLKDVIQSGLREMSAEFVVRDADWIVSVFAAKESVYAGISRPADNISDWNGGAIRFQREEGQISRAKFKLLEAEAVFGIDFTAFQEALDIGAAPGGWTSFLLDRGLKVTAVDPAKMHPSLMSLPNLTYLRKNADSVKFRESQFDLLVCDMSWSPKLTARLVADLLYSLVPGGTVIVTVKLLSKKPMALIQEVIQTFTEARLQVQRAKQLFHNRDEITLYMIKY